MDEKANQLSLEENKFEEIRSKANHHLSTLFKYEDQAPMVESVRTDFQALNSRVQAVFAKTDTNTEFTVL